MKVAKKIFAFALIVFATRSIASTILGHDYANMLCQKSIRTDGNATYITPTVVFHDRDFLVMSLSQSDISDVSIISQTSGEVETKAINDRILDFTSSKDALYALGENKVYLISKTDLDLINSSPTINGARNLSRYQFATGISYEDGKIYISHGELGVVVRDATTLSQIEKINFNLQTSRGHRSELSDVDVKNGKILLGVDNVTGSPDGSRGLEGYFLGSTQDVATSKFKSIDSAREALDHPYVFLQEDHFYAFNWFYLFDYKIRDLNRRGPLAPSSRYWNFETEFNFFGRPSIGEDHILGCAKSKQGQAKLLSVPRPLP